MQDVMHMKKVPINKLEPLAAAELLWQIAGDKLDKEYQNCWQLLRKSELLKFLDYNPQAIIQMAPLIRKGDNLEKLAE